MMRISLKWLATPQEMTFKKIARHTQAPSPETPTPEPGGLLAVGLNDFGAEPRLYLTQSVNTALSQKSIPPHIRQLIPYHY